MAAQTKDKDETKAVDTKGAHSAFVAALLEDAQSLRDEKENLLERIGDNREMLRRVARSGHLSQEQAEAVQAWYPTRVPKDKAEAPAPAEAPATA